MILFCAELIGAQLRAGSERTEKWGHFTFSVGLAYRTAIRRSPDRIIFTHADCHLECQLAEGSPRKGHVVAGSGEAGRAADTGNEAGGCERPCRNLQAGRIRAGAPWRGSMERRGDRESVRH